MQAVILAGGFGLRLRPLTDKTPKPMVPILGKPFLSYQLELMKNNGITGIVLSVGYLGQEIIDYFEDGAEIGLKIDYVIENNPMGTGGGLKLAAGLLKDNFFVIYGDSYLPVDYKEIEDFFRASGKTGLLVAYDNRQGDALVPCNVSVDKDMLVTNYKKNSQDKELYLVEAGVLAFKKSVLDFIPENKPLSLEQDIFPLLIARKELVCFKTNQRFYDIGSLDKLKKFEGYLNDHIPNTI